MSGGGDNVTYFAPIGATVATTTLAYGTGGSGDNQGLGDEGWGLENVLVTGLAAGVPDRRPGR